MRGMRNVVPRYAILVSVLLATLVVAPARVANAASLPSFQLPMRGHVNVIGYINGTGDHTNAHLHRPAPLTKGGHQQHHRYQDQARNNVTGSLGN